MNLKFSDRCEQGTDVGVMLFRKGGEYSCEPQGDGTTVVTHEPRTISRTIDGKRIPVVETKTQIPNAVLEQLLKFGPVTAEE